MNLTVGPLPPAVYWRRRAIVLGGLFLVVLLLTYACSGSGNASTQSGATPPRSTSPAATDVAGNLLNSPSAPVSQPSSSGPSMAPSVAPTEVMTSSPSPSAANSAGSTGIKTCTDAQILVIPAIASTSASTSRLVHGGTFDLKLKVRNNSSTTCRRDVGGIAEELRVVYGHTKIWSSDDCGKSQGKAHDIRTFAPHVEIYAEIRWSSYDITTTTCRKSSTPAKIGTYGLLGRVGTKSATTKFSIVA